MSKPESLKEQIAGLTPAQRALLEQRLRGRPIHRSEDHGIARSVERDVAPLSFAQQRLWFLDELAPGNTFYSISRAYSFRGVLDRDALRGALAAIVRRHEVLRTTFAVLDEQPVQRIAPEQDVELPVFHVEALPGLDREQKVKNWIASETGRPFDLATGPLLRAALLRMGEREHILLLAMHHIVSDGWSIGILLRELAGFYGELSRGTVASLPDLPIQYADFARWQRKWLRGDVLEEQLSYWKQHLKSLPVLELPSDRPRPPVQSFRGARESISFSSDLVARLRELSQREGGTLYMTLLAAFGVLLAKYTGQKDVVVGSLIAGRNRTEIEGLIGFFINTLVMRMNLSEDQAFRELLRHVREVALGAWAHQDLPFEKLVEELHPARSLAQNPLVQATLTLQNAPVTQLDLPGIASTPVIVETTSTHFDLEVYLTEQPNGLTCTFVYATDLFDRRTIVRMLDHYERLLEDVVSDAGRRISELSILPEAELRLILGDWNRTDAEYPGEKTVHRLFEEQVERTPEAIAVEFEGSQLTYGELNRRSNELALHLCRLGVGPEVLVGICLERSLEMVIAIFGILKAGGAYLPLDPSYPAERLAFMLQDAMPAVVVTESRLANRLPASAAQRRMCLDEPWPTAARLGTVSAAATALSENTAYVLYTSGSSGKPKGVSVPHRTVVNLLTSMADRLALGSDDRLLAVTTLSFDIAALEIYLPLTVGARIVLASREVASSGASLLVALNESGATVMQATPSTWRMMIEAGWQGKSPFKILCGGEALSRDLANQLLTRATSVLNLYGPTETTIWSTVYTVSDDDGPVPIGRPIANTQIYLLDAAGQPVPIGVNGEIYIGGAGVARGYLNRPDLTAERFVANPFCEQPSGRLYRTGDVGRYRPDGNIEYVGRVDEQFKLRGHRIEPGEIEAALVAHPGVNEAVVVVRDKSGDPRLIAYLVASNSNAPRPGDIRAFLKKTLPDSMVPSTFVMLEGIPRTPNGKVDRRALLEPGHDRPELEKQYVAPRDPMELKLTQIWENVLGIEPIGAHDDFFEIGGHSLLAVRLFSQIEKFFDRPLPLAVIFQAPTVESLADRLRQEGWQAPWASLVVIQGGKGRAPFFCVPGWGGNILGFYDLARELGADQPVYGLQAKGLDGKEEPLTRIEDMAAHYIKEVKAVLPKGPYLLGGASFGGSVAFEMARQLEAAGESAALVALFDAFAPPTAAVPWFTLMRRRFKGYRSRLAKHGRNVLFGSERRQYIRSRSRTLRRRIRSRVWEAVYAIYRRRSKPLPRVLQDVREAGYLAGKRYLAKTYRGKVTLFRADLRSLGDAAAPDMGWGRVALGGVEVREVPGDHVNMLLRPQVGLLAEHLRECIDRATGANVQVSQRQPTPDTRPA